MSHVMMWFSSVIVPFSMKYFMDSTYDRDFRRTPKCCAKEEGFDCESESVTSACGFSW